MNLKPRVHLIATIAVVAQKSVQRSIIWKPVVANDYFGSVVILAILWQREPDYRSVRSPSVLFSHRNDRSNLSDYMETRLKPLKTVEYSNYIPILTIDQESSVLKKSHNE